jgi:uncharacterized protein YaeQ
MPPVATLIREHIANPPELTALRHDIETGNQDIRDIALEVAEGTSYNQLRNAMRSLEWLATQDNALAILIMMGLFAFADKIFAHDICDAIELWIENNADADVTKGFDAQLTRGAIPDQKVSDWRTSLSRLR